MNPAEYQKLIEQDLQDGYSGFNFHHFYTTVAAVKDFSTYVEVGCFKGFSVAHLATQLAKRPGTKIYAVDLWTMTDDMLLRWSPQHQQLKDDSTALWGRFDRLIPPHQLLYDIYNANLQQRAIRYLVTDLRGDSSEMANHFANASVDFVFIDANHSYDSVKRDIIAWQPKVRSGGIIAGHDYS